MQTTYDYIVAGGGGAGAIVAARLSEDEHVNVLLLERGATNKGVATSEQPAMYLANLPTENVHNHFAEPAECNDHTAVIVPQGNLLGGGTSVNFLMYTRPSASDFEWGMDNWKFEDVKPYFAKYETYHSTNTTTSKDTHGTDGPLQVCQGHVNQAAMDEYFPAAKAVLGDSYVEAEDTNDFSTLGAQVSGWSKWIDPKTGKRSGSADAYLHPNAGRTNLTVVCEAPVTKVNLDGNKATGVDAIIDGQTVTFKASREVIVSAGAFGTPKLLELSGIGNKEHLSKAGIECKVENSGVGESYQDHLLFLCMHHAAKEAETHDELYRQQEPEFSDAQAKFANADGPLRTNNIDAVIKWRPTDEEAAASPFAELFKREFLPYPDRPLFLFATITGCCADFSVVPEGKYFMTGGYLEYPQSRGSVHVTTDDHTKDARLTGFYVESEEDIQVLMYCYKKNREIARRLKTYRGEFAPSHPPFDPASEAAIDGFKEEEKATEHDTVAPASDNLPGAIDKLHVHPVQQEAQTIKDITYTEADDAVLRKWVKGNCGTTWHPLGTAGCRPKDKGGAVDARLRVYGTKNLRVCDVSILPFEPGCNLASTAYVIGERGSDLIKEDAYLFQESLDEKVAPQVGVLASTA
jgi:alcohol oxidase